MYFFSVYVLRRPALTLTGLFVFLFWSYLSIALFISLNENNTIHDDYYEIYIIWPFKIEYTFCRITTHLIMCESRLLRISLFVYIILILSRCVSLFFFFNIDI